MINITQAIRSLCPEATFTVTFDGEIINWNSKYKKPSKEEIDIAFKNLQKDYEKDQYKRDRAAAYPPVVDQLDMIFNGGLDAWKEQIQAVKHKYPKPE